MASSLRLSKCQFDACFHWAPALRHKQVLSVLFCVWRTYFLTSWFTALDSCTELNSLRWEHLLVALGLPLLCGGPSWTQGPCGSEKSPVENC